MNLLAKLRKGFSFFLMSFGVSTYKRKSLQEEAPEKAPTPEPK